MKDVADLLSAEGKGARDEPVVGCLKNSQRENVGLGHWNAEWEREKESQPWRKGPIQEWEGRDGPSRTSTQFIPPPGRFSSFVCPAIVEKNILTDVLTFSGESTWCRIGPKINDGH